MTEKRHVGRPKLSDDMRRGKTYFVRFRDAEYNELKVKAAGAGVSVAAFIRNAIFSKEKEN